MITLKPQSKSRQPAPQTSLVALLRPKSFDKLQRANELRKVDRLPNETGDLGPKFGEDRFFIDYTASLRKSMRTEQMRKVAPKTAQPPELEVISNCNEWHALDARRERDGRQAVVDLIKRGWSTARINAVTGKRLP